MMLRAISCLTMLLALAACSRSIEVRHEVKILMADLGQGMKLEVSADGRPAPILKTDQTSTGPTMTFETHGTLKGTTHRLPELKVKILFGCGWREFPLKVTESWPVDEVRRLAQEGASVQYTANMPQFPGEVASLWVDNRHGNAGELGLGPIKMAVPRDKTWRLDAYTCDTPIPVTFDGAPMGEIPGAQAGSVSQPTIVVDPSGTRCYNQYEVWYAPQNEGGGGKSKPVLLAGRKLYYSAEFIAYVFEEPPMTTISPRGDNPHYQTLVDAKCR